jgi:hypothetical protein
LTPLTTKPHLITRSTRRQSRRPDNHGATAAPRRRRRRCCSRRAPLDLTPLTTKPHLITRSTRRHNRSPAAVPGPRVWNQCCTQSGPSHNQHRQGQLRRP